jgi:hypothetical protein
MLSIGAKTGVDVHRVYPANTARAISALHSVLKILSAVALIAVSGCEKKFDLSTLPQQQDAVLDTAYVQIFPPFSGFSGPEDVMMGNDQLLYVADTKANRVVMMNRAGQQLSQRTMLHPLSLAQDSRLDLLVGGEIVAANGDTAGAIFRVHLVSASADSAHRLELARVDTLWRELANPRRRFPGITVFGDNFFLAVRTGPDNSSFIDPDARVMLFDNHDVFITPVPALTTRSGSGITDINKPSAIASFPGARDFVLAQSSEGVAYGAVWMRYQATADFEGWLPQFDPARPEDRSSDFIRPNRYLLPDAVTIDRARRDVFIADAQLDSVFKFNSRGRLKSESFGFTRSSGTMKRPTGLTFFEKVLYVLDGEQGLLLRFRLTTDVPR